MDALGVRHLHCEKPVRHGGEAPRGEPRQLNVVLAQMVSVLFAGIPFMVYLMASEELSPAFHDFYTDHLVIGAAIVIVLVFVELLLMGIQAHRAHFTEVDRVVRGATHTEA